MEFSLPETSLLQIKESAGEKNTTTFTFEPLSPGYGITIGNSLRRILLSSLSGSAITYVRIEGVTHEFSTINGVKEDVVDLILNLKGLRLKLHGDEPTSIILEANKVGIVTAKDFKENTQVEIIDPDYYIATLDKSGKLYLEATLEKGRGYIPTELKKEQKLPLGTISIDSIFTPVKKVHYDIENTRVGRMTNFDKLTMEITTDGTVSPKEALQNAAKILVEHFNLISDLDAKRETPQELTNISATDDTLIIEPETKKSKKIVEPKQKKSAKVKKEAPKTVKTSKIKK